MGGDADTAGAERLSDAQSVALLADLEKIGYSLGERRREAAE